MGVLFALLSMTLFSTANITVNRGFDGETRSGGAFLSILITFALALCIWLWQGLQRGFSPFNAPAFAWFVLAGVLTIFIGRVFLYASIQHLGAVKASAIKRLNPFFSVLLAVLLLGESVSLPMAFGMGLICVSFAVLVRQSTHSAGNKSSSGPHGALSRLANLGYLYGPVSAFAYASGYVARKQGLLELPDAAFGTMTGALAGIVVFVATSGFLQNYRTDIRKTFTVFNPWLLAAGILSSAGQLCYFVALNYSSISRIALITSMEVFVTIFLSAVIFRSNERPTADVVVAGLLGVAGTVCVILT